MPHDFDVNPPVLGLSPRTPVEGSVEVNGAQVEGLFVETLTQEENCGWSIETRYFDASVGGKLIRQDQNICVKRGFAASGAVKI